MTIRASKMVVVQRMGYSLHFDLPQFLLFTSQLFFLEAN
jgi:hypothetical protein